MHPWKAVLAIAAMIVAALTMAGGPAAASSHREAPLISLDPQADNTDLYAFRSPDRPDTVTIVANYIPLEEPNGGPNFISFGDDVRYEIHIDNSGDARPDITYRFTFETKRQNPNTFLYITGPVTSPTDPNFNLQQCYTVERITYGRGGKTEVIGYGDVPPVNVGPRSTPNYASIAAQAIAELDGGVKAFAGQRDDAFFVDLGSIFDLGGLRPFNSLHLLPLADEAGVDGVNGYNTHTISLQIPIAQLTADRKGAEATQKPVLGIYASASRQRVRVLQRDGSLKGSGSWQQVSRLGNPLINEVIIPLGQKDFWNAQPPHKDAQFEQYYLNPELAGIVNLLYTKPTNPNGVLQTVDTSGRADLVAILLTGVKLPDGTPFTFTGDTRADLLRLNVAVPPTAPGSASILGVLDGDLAGFPNGRRLADDVTDIELKAVAQGYGMFLNGLLGLPNKSPNNLVSDGVQANDRPFLAAFPYQAEPHAGYDSSLHR
jgi:hypothetical protein